MQGEQAKNEGSWVPLCLQRPGNLHFPLLQVILCNGITDWLSPQNRRLTLTSLPPAKRDSKSSRQGDSVQPKWCQAGRCVWHEGPLIINPTIPQKQCHVAHSLVYFLLRSHHVLPPLREPLTFLSPRDWPLTSGDFLFLGAHVPDCQRIVKPGVLRGSRLLKYYL